MLVVVVVVVVVSVIKCTLYNKLCTKMKNVLSKSVLAFCSINKNIKAKLLIKS